MCLLVCVRVGAGCRDTRHKTALHRLGFGKVSRQAKYCDVATKEMYLEILIAIIKGIVKADEAAAMSKVLHAHQHQRASLSSSSSL